MNPCSELVACHDAVMTPNKATDTTLATSACVADIVGLRTCYVSEASKASEAYRGSEHFWAALKAELSMCCLKGPQEEKGFVWATPATRVLMPLRAPRPVTSRNEVRQYQKSPEGLLAHSLVLGCALGFCALGGYSR